MHSPGFDPQLSLGRDSAGERYLQYREDVKGKTHQGGLSSKVKPRTLKVYGSPNPSRNVVNLFAQYIRLLPGEPKNGSFYKYSLPASKRTGSQWYSDRPIGVNQLKKVVKSIMTKGGLEGKYTNHSLRVTCVTRMFEAGVDEQLIKTFTVHKSDAVCDYKRVSENLLRKASSTVTSSASSEQAESLPSLEPKKHRAPVNENVSPDDCKFVKEVMSPLPPKAHENPCPLTGSDNTCSTLCSVLKKIDQEVEKSRKKVRFTLEVESSSSPQK